MLESNQAIARIPRCSPERGSESDRPTSTVSGHKSQNSSRRYSGVCVNAAFSRSLFFGSITEAMPAFRFCAFVAREGRSSQSQIPVSVLDHSTYTLLVSTLMSIQALALKYREAQMRSGAVGFKDPPYTIDACVRVHAETRRIFQAIVVPEYLEAWLRIPEAGTSWEIAPLWQTTGFALKWCSAKAAQTRILAAYKIRRKRNLTICWTLEKDELPRDSTVIIRINGDFGWSVLSLFHVGFRTFDEFAWHRQLWGTSLERLANLF